LLGRLSPPTEARIEALSLASLLSCMRGDSDEGRRLQRKAELDASNGTDSAKAHVAYSAGMLALFQGNTDEAWTRFESALSFRETLDDDAGLSNILIRLATVGLIQDNLDVAQAFSAEAISLSESCGEEWQRSAALCVTAMISWKRGKYSEVAPLLWQSIGIKMRFGDKMGCCLCCEVLSWVLVSMGRNEQAAVLIGAISSIWRDDLDVPLVGYYMPFRESTRMRCRESLSDGAFRRAFERGQEFSLRDLIRYVLSEKLATATPVKGGASSGLTYKEQQVAILVARDMSNRAIASTLGMSVRTAENHVYRILRKLSLANRSEISYWLATRRGKQ
ncbi:response regulator transcription factor, partial [Bacillus subtilis]